MEIPGEAYDLKSGWPWNGWPHPECKGANDDR